MLNNEIIDSYNKLYKKFVNIGERNPKIAALVSLSRISKPGIKEHEVKDEIKHLEAIIFDINTTIQ